MASCYGKVATAATDWRLDYLPIRTKLPGGREVEIDAFRESEHEAGLALMNHVIEEGLSWPFEELLDMEGFRAYFLSHAAFVVRPIPAIGSEATGTVEGDGPAVLGAFYVKPNFPGRCSHVCNGGFITEPRCRRQGVGRLMGQAFLRFAKDLGFHASMFNLAFLHFVKDFGFHTSMFNLVFATNEASIRLWRSLGFREMGVLPKAGRLKGIDGLVDAVMFTHDLDALDDDTDQGKHSLGALRESRLLRVPLPP